MRNSALAIPLLAILFLGACGSDESGGQAYDPAPPEPAERTSELQGAEPAAPEPAPNDEPPALVASCDACHGRQAPSPWPDLATIHGLPAEAIENALYDFRGGLRPCRKSRCSAEGQCPDLTMCDMAEGLDDDDIVQLAAWYADQEFVAVEQDFDEELAEHGRWLHMTRCESCHTQGGMIAVDQSNRLRGQHQDYLRQAMLQFREGERTAVGLMDAQIKALQDDEIEALLAFYATPFSNDVPEP